MSSTAQQAPVIPPRPARTQANNDTPEVPPRPARLMNRSISPNPERFAQSPLNDNLRAKSNKSLRFEDGDPTEDEENSLIPSIGEEGIEYSVIPDEAEKRTVGDEVALQAPKPKLPASAAKDRLATVTRTDSDRAASYGIGRPSSQTPSLKKKASTTSQGSGTDFPEEKEGIPEIGQRIPLLSNAGDVQAPSPAPGSGEGLRPRHHGRKTSARGFVDLPDDTYGLRGHGKEPKDRLDKAYYEKHPEILEKEKHFRRHEHDRASDFALPSDQLNKLVRETGSRNGDEPDGIPSEDLGYEAHVEYASRMSRPTSTSPQKEADEATEEPSEGIHVDQDEATEQGAHIEEDRADNYSAPILAEDEVEKDPRPYEQTPAVVPPPERSGSAFGTEEIKSRSSSIHAPTIEVQPAPPEDEDYEPLFSEDEKEKKSKAADLREGEQPKQRFPSKDVWEDAPNSVHVTTEVSNPQPPEDPESPTESKKPDPAKKAEILQIAKEQDKPRSWVEKQLKMAVGTSSDPQKKFPSRDVWEDTPDSLQLETTVSGPQQPEEEASPVEVSKPQIPARPARKATDDGASGVDKPGVPERPKAKPAVPDKPKPNVPGRPAGGKIAALQAGFMADLNKRLQVGPHAPKKEEPIAQDLTEDTEKALLSDARKSRARGPQRRAPATGKSPGPAAVGTSSLSFSTPRTVWAIEPAGVLSVDGKEETKEDEPKTLATNMAGEPVVEANTETKEAVET